MPTSRYDRLIQWSSAIGVLAAIAGVLTSLTAGYRDTLARRQSVETLRSSVQLELALKSLADSKSAIEKVRQLNTATESRLAAVESQLKLVSANPEGSPSAGVAREVGVVRELAENASKASALAAESVKAVDARVARLETVILADPQKAVAIPLLQRDIANIDSRTLRDVQTLQADNARLYDLMKWLVGLMGIVSLSLIGTAVGNVFKRESKSEGKGSPTPDPASSAAKAP